MTTMVEATLPAEQFALYETLSRYPTAEFTILRLVANGTDRPLPFVWASGDNLDELPAAIAEDPSTENVTVMADLDDEYLLRMEWMAQSRLIIYIILEEDATIIDAAGKNGIWQFRILFPEHDSVSATNEFCEEYGIDLEFTRIYQVTDSFRRGQYGLSERQYDAIVTAYGNGFYEIPRTISLQELSEDLGISHQALSERVRRGHETLIANTLRPELEMATNP